VTDDGGSAGSAAVWLGFRSGEVGKWDKSDAGSSTTSNAWARESLLSGNVLRCHESTGKGKKKMRH